MGARRSLLLLAGFAVARSTSAMWADIPTWQLVQRSDVAVIATLQDVRGRTNGKIEVDDGLLVVERTNGRIEVDEGKLVVEVQVFGKTPSSKTLRLRWSNEADIVCPRIDHERHRNVRALWLLKIDEEEGVVRADYPGRVIPLADAEVVAYALQELGAASAAVQQEPKHRATVAVLERAVKEPQQVGPSNKRMQLTRRGSLVGRCPRWALLH